MKEAGLKLKSPNFIVSPTRLRVLNVPLTWDSKQLKACCHKAVLTRATKAQPKVLQVRPRRVHACTPLRSHTVPAR